MDRNVLVIAGLAGAENFAREMSEQLAWCWWKSHPAAVLVCRLCVRASTAWWSWKRVWSRLTPVWADLVWQNAGLALPVQMNFAISGSARLGREIKAALVRREGEHALARRAAAREIENELKTSVTGLLLESELALREPAGSATLEPKLRHLVELAGSLRERLRVASQMA